MYALDTLKMRGHEKLTVHDALITIAVCAAEIDDWSSFDDIHRISTLALANSLFSNKIEVIKKRVYSIVNSNATENWEKAVDIVNKSLPVELKETAFAWAADIIMNDGSLTSKNKEFLDRLSKKLSIDLDTSTKIIEVTAIRNRSMTSGKYEVNRETGVVNWQ